MKRSLKSQGQRPKTEGQKPRQLLLLCLSIFLLAFAIRTLTWQDNRRDAWKVQTSVTARYKESARQLAGGEFRNFVSDVRYLGHPPGYPILLAGIFKTVGESDSALQFIQIIIDSAAAIVLFLITVELFSLTVATIAGLLAAVSPQFAYFSVLLLPDSLIVFHILLAVYFMARSRKRFMFSSFLIAGALVGLSCWLRANALLLPLFLSVIAALIVQKGKRLRAASAVLAGALVVIAPVTIKNAIVFHRFIPVSLGTGQTLLEGIADYDSKGALNIPNTDLGLMRQEAQWYGKPEYAEHLFGKDGIERDRIRVARGFSVIGAHPLWFASVMARRAAASTRLDPVPVLLPESPVSHKLDDANAKPIWEKSGSELITSSTRSQKATFTPVGSELLRIKGDDENYGSQLASELINVERFHDYVLRLPFKLEQGRAIVKITAPEENRVLAYIGVDVVEGVRSDDQIVHQLAIPFVSANNTQVRIDVANNAAIHPTMLIGKAQIVDLGPSSLSWLRYLRMPLRVLQRFFTTAWFLPFVIIGIVLLVQRRRLEELAILLVVPAYFLIVQSALHTERRYVYVIHFFFAVLVSVALCWVAAIAMLSLKKLRKSVPLA